VPRDTSGGGLWPDDDGEINILTNDIGLWPQGDDAVLSSVVVCGRLTLLSFSKILLLNHDPPLHTDCDWWRGGGEAVEKRFLAYARSGS